MYRGKEIFKPLNTGWVDEHVACVREWVANIFFYRKGDTTIMIDAGLQLRPARGKDGLARHRPEVHPAYPHHPSGHRPRRRGRGGQPRPVPEGEALCRRDREPLSHRRGAPQGDLPPLQAAAGRPSTTKRCCCATGEVFEIDGITHRMLPRSLATRGGTWCTSSTTSTSSRAIRSGSARTAATASFPRWRRDNKLAVQVAGGAGAEASHARPAARHPDGPHRLDGQSLLRLCAPAISSARRSRRECTTRPRRMTPTTSRTTQRRMRSAAFCRRCRRSDAEWREVGKPASLRGFGE